MCFLLSGTVLFRLCLLCHFENVTSCYAPLYICYILQMKRKYRKMSAYWLWYLVFLLLNLGDQCYLWGHPGYDRMVAGFTPTYMQSVPITTNVFSSNTTRSEVDSIQHYVICQWLAARRWYFPGIQVSSTNKTDRHVITEILLTLNIKTLTILIVVEDLFVFIIIISITIDLIDSILFSLKLRQDICVNLNKNFIIKCHNRTLLRNS